MAVKQPEATFEMPVWQAVVIVVLWLGVIAGLIAAVVSMEQPPAGLTAYAVPSDRTPRHVELSLGGPAVHLVSDRGVTYDVTLAGVDRDGAAYAYEVTVDKSDEKAPHIYDDRDLGEVTWTVQYGDVYIQRTNQLWLIWYPIGWKVQ